MIKNFFKRIYLAIHDMHTCRAEAYIRMMYPTNAADVDRLFREYNNKNT